MVSFWVSFAMLKIPIKPEVPCLGLIPPAAGYFAGWLTPPDTLLAGRLADSAGYFDRWLAG